MENIFPLLLTDVGFAPNGVPLLRDIQLSIAGGARTVILGANGAGKSVLMRLMHGLLAPSSGRVLWNGSAARPASQAMVFQRPVMLRRSTLANVAYGLKLHGVPQAERQLRAEVALARVGLGHLAERPARVLSGGEQQRIALARAWALEPRILFLDEPTASLDPGAAREVERIVTEIHRAGTTIVMTTHNLGQARRLADEIIFLHQGRITERTPAADFFEQPRSAEAENYLTGELP
ncbi:MAG: ATP-binding cassette domain-containing protein [Proteobacteria bacterium]|nr:ATP-binding cassette domain-containing protein [Pseudomonadota bacterium]